MSRVTIKRILKKTEGLRRFINSPGISYTTSYSKGWHIGYLAALDDIEKFIKNESY